METLSLHPFSGEKKEVPWKDREGKFYTLEDETGKRQDIVRIIREDAFLDTKKYLYSKEEISSGQRVPLEYVEGMVAIAQKTFQELKEKYGICVDAHYVIAKEKDTTVVLGLAERVCANSKEINLEKKELSQTIRGLICYYDDVLSSFDEKTSKTEPFFWDITRRGQYVFGSTQSDTSSKLRLVDVDPHWISDDIENSDGRDLNRALRFLFFDLFRHYNEMEGGDESFLEMKKAMLDLCKKWRYIAEAKGSSEGMNSSREIEEWIEKY